MAARGRIGYPSAYRASGLRSLAGPQGHHCRRHAYPALMCGRRDRPSDRVVESFTRMYERYELDDAQRMSIDRGAAEALFPRLQARAAQAVG